MPDAVPPETLDIGPASIHERAWAASLMASSEPWRTLGRDLAACTASLADGPGSELLIARSAGAAVGFLFVRLRGLAGSPYLASIAVVPEARGRRIGEHLITHLIAHLERAVHPARHLFLCVSSFNSEAQRFYARLGFHQVGELPDYLIDGASELLLCKRLHA